MSKRQIHVVFLNWHVGLDVICCAVHTNLCDVWVGVQWQSWALGRCQHMVWWWHWWSCVCVQCAVRVQSSTPGARGWGGGSDGRRVQKVGGWLFWGGALCRWQRGAWLAGVFVSWKRRFGGAWGGRQGRVLRPAGTEGLWGSRRWEGRGRKIISGFSAGHFVDLDVVDGKDSTAGGAGDTTLQPVIIYMPDYGDHFPLSTRQWPVRKVVRMFIQNSFGPLL